MTSIRVEAPDPRSAARLGRVLSELGTTTVVSGQSAALEVVLQGGRGRDRDRLIVDTLTAVKRWVHDQRLTSVRVWIDSDDGATTDLIRRSASDARPE